MHCSGRRPTVAVVIGAPSAFVPKRTTARQAACETENHDHVARRCSEVAAAHHHEMKIIKILFAVLAALWALALIPKLLSGIFSERFVICIQPHDGVGCRHSHCVRNQHRPLPKCFQKMTAQPPNQCAAALRLTQGRLAASRSCSKSPRPRPP